jgi:hypothetical protein
MSIAIVSFGLFFLNDREPIACGNGGQVAEGTAPDQARIAGPGQKRLSAKGAEDAKEDSEKKKIGAKRH